MEVIYDSILNVHREEARDKFIRFPKKYSQDGDVAIKIVDLGIENNFYDFILDDMSIYCNKKEVKMLFVFGLKLVLKKLWMRKMIVNYEYQKIKKTK
ncbi:hypothetical protein BZG02_00045 [Labilibaculum filiforme]|uniref:Uncharacterized protein n=1 Tax=Labilibaculum filiforme TaxID=1940526 RepID=A0A2N3I5A1_9BACT|nr:hypothetical protein [Labilibaculum filiforme]PKQ65433.1 hypothetical protein BZG02_00045 [Labilibaculum filiforme]